MILADRLALVTKNPNSDVDGHGSKPTDEVCPQRVADFDGAPTP